MVQRCTAAANTAAAAAHLTQVCGEAVLDVRQPAAVARHVASCAALAAAAAKRERDAQLECVIWCVQQLYKTIL
jgi:hypothetical protein